MSRAYNARKKERRMRQRALRMAFNAYMVEQIVYGTGVYSPKPLLELVERRTREWEARADVP